jgi:hypothetical protein
MTSNGGHRVTLPRSRSAPVDVAATERRASSGFRPTPQSGAADVTR